MHRNLILALACAGVGAEASRDLHARDESASGVTAASTATGAVQEVAPASSVLMSSGSSAMGAIPVSTASAASPAESEATEGMEDSDFAIGNVDPTAALEHLQTYAEVCFPNATSGEPDFNAPCNVYTAIEAQCMLGPAGLELLTRPSLERINNLLQGQAPNDTLSPEAQRACVCQSQYLDATKGCSACGVRMSLSNQEYADRYDALVSDVMEEYCRVDSTPTQPLILSVMQEMLKDGEQWFNSVPSTTSSVDSATDVSLYYTMSVPGSSAYSIPFPTASAGNVTFTSLKTSGGQIVPTATASGEAADETGDVDIEDDAVPFEGGAAQGVAVGSQAIGILGFAALAALF